MMYLKLIECIWSVGTLFICIFAAYEAAHHDHLKEGVR